MEMRSDPTQRSVLAFRVGVAVSAQRILNVDRRPGDQQLYMIGGEVRLWWPLNATEQDLEEVMQEMFIKAQDRMEEILARRKGKA